MFPGTRAQDSVIEADEFAKIAEYSIPLIGEMMEFAWRRHLHGATKRAISFRTASRSGELPDMAIGFADMVGFTVLSRHLSDEDLELVVSRFEDIAFDVVAELGGRVIKMIGDEVLFVADDPFVAARIGLGLADAYAGDDLLSDVRVALAYGPVLARDGDVFGPVVNLASRIVAVARRGSVLVSAEMRTYLLGRAEEVVTSPDDDHRPEVVVGDAGDQAYAGDALPSAREAESPLSADTVGEAEDGELEFVLSALRPRVLRDIGLIQLWELGHHDSVVSRGRRLSSRRWERVSEILRDLEELRGRGERVLAAGIRASDHVGGSLRRRGHGLKTPSSSLDSADRGQSGTGDGVPDGDTDDSAGDTAT